MHFSKTLFFVSLLTLASAIPRSADGHGFEGDRFFPPTIQTDDPFAVDELSFPTVSIFNNPPGGGSPRTREMDIGAEFDKEIFPKFALGISDTYTFLNPRGGSSVSGFDNLSVSAKYQLLEIPAHEFIFSLGMEFDIGGTGRKVLDSPYGTLSPILYFGKGFGDLPDSLPFLKPFAITGTLGQDIPMRSGDPNALEWGIALEYSLLYLEQSVKDTGMPRPFRDTIPLVEFAMTTPENRGGGVTTGTVNPGVLWEGRYCQLGAEAIVPINHHSGANVGMIFSVQIYIDDIFPKVFGHPLFGGSESALPPNLTK